MIEDEEEENIFSARRISDDDYTEDLTSVRKSSGSFNVVTAADDYGHDSYYSGSSSSRA